MRTARQVLTNPPVPPFRGSVALINAMLRDVLHDLGYETTACAWRANGRMAEIDHWIPLDTARSILQVQAGPVVDVEIRDNTSFVYPMARRGRQKNVVFFHALVGYGAQWLGNDAVDGYWANSDYLGEVLASFLSMPNWKLGRLLEPRAFSLVKRITLPLPYLERPDVRLEEGAEELPANVMAALESDDILGHCVSNKLSERSTFAIILALNQMALQGGIGRRFRLFVDQALYRSRRSALQAGPSGAVSPEFAPLLAALERMKLTLDDILIPIPRLAQASLFKLVGACRFGLQYHFIPESFGLFPLESVCQGCPIYTNGAGNLRHLLPPGHGIEVIESEAMVFDDPIAHVAVAQKIFHDAVVNLGPAREACHRGREYIKATYTREAMRRDVEARLAELEEPPAEQELDSLRIALNPMVRSWNPASRRVISDFASLELTPDEAGLLQEVVGQRCGELECRRHPAAMEIVEGLFGRGMLALSQDGPR